jgi:Carboxypeptidase regulatory-like domain
LKALLAALLVVATVLAGCSDGGGNGDGPTTTAPPLQAGKGAIAGLVINDVFRPVPGALVLLQPGGLTTNSDASGQFTYTNLEPGAYVLRIQADEHEAAPTSVEVRAGEYAEVETIARRVINEGNRIVTREYSVFIPCAADYVVNGNVFDCTLDQSGDSFRAAFTSNYTAYQNVTYLVTEMKANNPDRFEVQLRGADVCEDPQYHAVAQFEGDYVKIVMQFGERNLEHENVFGYGENAPWVNDCDLDTILFTDSQFREELQENQVPVCCGAGVHMGIKAKFVQSLFLGEPEVDIASYGVLG